jgi:hypothetical protein
MAFPDYFPVVSWILRRLTGRLARRLYLCIILFLLVVSTVVRARTYLMTRRIQSVISGLSKLRVDESVEEEVLRTVPYLVRGQQDWQVKRTVETGDIDTGTERGYYVTISNESGWMRFERFASRFSNISYSKDDRPKSWILGFADVLGYRYLSFGASVLLLDGKVSRISYGIADRFARPQQFGEIISVRNFHGRWLPYRQSLSVTHTDDESPQFLVSGGKDSLGVRYAFDAPPELISHVFAVNLSCFWGLRGCHHPKQVSPLLWRDRENIEAAAIARLKTSKEPCPDRILPGRVRYLPDVEVVLLEVTKMRIENVNEEGHRVDDFYSDYRVVEELQGHSNRTWNSVRTSRTIPSPQNPSVQTFNPNWFYPKPGDRFLLFDNHTFYSCATVLATPSALAAVRSAVHAPKRLEDRIARGLM